MGYDAGFVTHLLSRQQPGTAQLHGAGSAGTSHSAKSTDSFAESSSLLIRGTVDVVEFGSSGYAGRVEIALAKIEFETKQSVNTALRGDTRRSPVAEQAMELYKLAGLSDGKGQDLAEAAGEVLNPLEKLKEHFSPANTAQRVVNFALSRYGYGRFSAEDSAENRKAYSEFIRPAVEDGFHKAVAAFGELPENVMNELHTTLEAIHGLFDEFLGGAKTGAETNAAG